MSDLLKDIAEQAKKLPDPVEKPDESLLVRTTPQKNTITMDQVIKESQVVPKKSRKLSDIQSQTIQPNVIEEMANNIQRLEEQVTKVLEMSETNAKKYPFPEGATATNHSTGAQIVFSRGQWWYLDADE